MITFLNQPELFFYYTQLNGFKYCYVRVTLQFNLSHLFTELSDQIVLFLTIQFSRSHLVALSLNVKQFYLTYRTLSGATNSGQSWLGSNGNEGVLHIPLSTSITGTSPSDCLVLYTGYLLWRGILTPLQRCNLCILQPQPTGLRNYFDVTILFLCTDR